MSKYAPTVGVASTHPSDMPKDHAELPVWNAENWFFEDFEVGHKIRSLRRTISEGESMQFNALVLDMHPYVADQIFAEREGIFGKRLVAGAFVFSAGLGLVATNCVNAFSYGYDKLRFIKPGVHRRHDLLDPHPTGQTAQIQGDGPDPGVLRSVQGRGRTRALLRASADGQISRRRGLRATPSERSVEPVCSKACWFST